MTRVIEISGKSGHGKDCLGEILKNELERYNQKVLITHFGDPVKWFAKQYFGYKGVKDVNDRTILTTVGTDIGRGYNENYWANIIGGFIAATARKNLYDVVIIPDLRFYSEHETISRYCREELMPLYTIRINRFNPDGTPYKNPNMTEEQLNHISECELDGFLPNYVIKNDGDLDWLKECAHTIIAQILPIYKKYKFDNSEN